MTTPRHIGYFLDPIVGAVAKKLQSRSNKGINKYGVMLTRKDLKTSDWANHLQEELLDAANYTERLIQDLKIIEASGEVLGNLTNFQKVQEFCRVFEHDAPADLWLDLILEEFTELLDARGLKFDYRVSFADNGKPVNRVAMLDGICDLLYVTYGLAHSLGWHADNAFAEVHRSNMTKLGEDGRPIKREDGKIMNGPNYDPPHLEGFVES